MQFTILSKAIHRFIVISIKIPMKFFTKVLKVLKFILNQKRPWLAGETATPNFKIYYRAIIKKKKTTMVLAQKQKCRSMDYIIEKMQCFQQPCRKTRHRERLAEREIISRMFEKAAGKQHILCPLKLHRIYIMHVHVCVFI